MSSDPINCSEYFTSGFTLPIYLGMDKSEEENQPLALLVEDDDLVRRSLCRAFRRVGISVASCDGAQCAAPGRLSPLELLAGSAPDVAIVDWHLQGGDSHELIVTLDTLYPNSPIIVYSADSRSSTQVQAERAGAWLWLDKSRGSVILLHAFTEALAEAERRKSGEGLRTMPDIERHAILSAVRRFGSVKRASESLGISVPTLYRRLESYDQEDRNAV